MGMIVFGALEGMLFFLGLGMLISTKPIFLIIMVILGIVLGIAAGVFLGRQTQPDLYLWIGPVLSAGCVLLLALAVNVLLDESTLATRWLITVSLLATAPGMLIGWLLGRNSEQSRVGRSVVRVTPGGGTERLPTPPIEQGRLRHIMPITSQPHPTPLEAEIQGLRALGNPVVSMLPNQQTAIVLKVQGIGRTASIYSVCAPTYPTTAPTVMVEIEDAYGQAQQVPVHSATLAHWAGQPMLVQVATEILATL